MAHPAHPDDALVRALLLSRSLGRRPDALTAWASIAADEQARRPMRHLAYQHLRLLTLNEDAEVADAVRIRSARSTLPLMTPSFSPIP